MKALLMLAAAAVTTVIRGWALKMMWNWFVVPLGIPALSLPAAIGIGLTVAYLTYTDSNKLSFDTAAETSKSIERIITAFLMPFYVVFIGWVLTFFL